ncbi:MAG: hypothetical protein ACKVS8_14435 [Phycisphaerales bacterium]
MTKAKFVRFAALLAVPALLAVGGCKADRVENESAAVTKSCTGEAACSEAKTCSKAEACCSAKAECADKAAAAKAN